MVIKRSIILLFLSLGSVALFYIFKHYNPLNHAFFPKCPVKHFTGYDCPGCGGQRAVHFIVNGEFEKAFLQNPLLFLLIPYLILGFYLQLIPNPTIRELKIRKILYGYRAIQVLFIVIVGFTILRNL